MNEDSISIVPATEVGGVENCVVVGEGEIPTLVDIVGAATSNNAYLDSGGEEAGDDRFAVQFPGHKQELLGCDAIFGRIRSLMDENSRGGLADTLPPMMQAPMDEQLCEEFGLPNATPQSVAGWRDLGKTLRARAERNWKTYDEVMGSNAIAKGDISFYGLMCFLQIQLPDLQFNKSTDSDLFGVRIAAHVEKPSLAVLPSEWRTGLEFRINGVDEWLESQGANLDSNSTFVVVSAEPNKNDYLDGMDIVAQEKTSGVQISFENYSYVSGKAIQI